MLFCFVCNDYYQYYCCYYCIRSHFSLSLYTSDRRIDPPPSMEAQFIPRPSSASQQSDNHIYYGGSRSLQTRFRYKNSKSLSGFAELVPSCRATPEMLYGWLDDCELVERVEWQTTKTSQGNVGVHASERNIKVFPKQERAGKKRAVEFEITRNAHMSKKTKCPFTVSVMFKDPAAHLVPHAWAILRHVCRDKELFPEKVTQWMNDALKNHTGQEQEAVQEEEEPAPGSASAEPRRKSRCWGGVRSVPGRCWVGARSVLSRCWVGASL